jgi:hypothetical protein
MKQILLIVLTLAVVSGTANWVSAQETKPISLSLVDPVQIVNRDTAIKGFRFNLIYGNNAGLTGVDLGLANWITGDVEGIQWGIINKTEGNFTGWQSGPVQMVGGHMLGVQTSWLVSMNESGKGLQWSGVTVSDDFIGLQVGVVNYAVELHGIQIGLINIIKNGGMLPVFPFFNFSFDE